MAQEEINESVSQEVGVITSEEELAAALAGSSDPLGEEDDIPPLKQPKAEDEEDSEEEGELGNLNSFKTDGVDNTGVEFNKDKHKTIVHYLNDKFGLELAIDQIPEDFTLEQQAETVADLLDRASKGFATRMSEYKAVDDLLRTDAEVAMFLKAKQEGKSLREFASEFASSSDGMADELLVAQKLKEVMADASDEDIQDIIDGYKEKDKLSNIAEGYRRKDAAQRAEQEQLTARQKEHLARQEQERLQQEQQAFGSYLKGITKIHGVPFTDDMRKEVYSAVTKPVDQDGNTLIDVALQSDQGLALMALGLTQMQKLLAATGSISKNKTQKSIMDRLSASPETLQSSSSGNKGGSMGDNEIEIAANMF